MSAGRRIAAAFVLGAVVAPICVPLIAADLADLPRQRDMSPGNILNEQPWGVGEPSAAVVPAAIDKGFRLYMLPQGVFAVAGATRPEVRYAAAGCAVAARRSMPCFTFHVVNIAVSVVHTTT